MTTPECALEDELLVAYRDYDVELLDTLKSDNRISRLEPYAARLARTLQIDEGGGRQSPHAPAVNVMIDEKEGGQPTHATPANVVIEPAPTGNSSHEIPTLEGIRARVGQLRVKRNDKEMKVEGGGNDSSKGTDADSVEALGYNNADIDEAAVVGAGTENNETAPAPCPPISETDPGNDHDLSEEDFDLT